jgi:chromosome segregation ATPase
LAEAAAARDVAAQRAARIETELAAVRERLADAEADRASGSEEVRELEGERAQLLARLAELEQREAALRTGGREIEALQAEHRALEELLEEAAGELRSKEEAIHALQRQVKKQERADALPARRADQLAARLRALYKNLEIDDRVVDDLIGLRDEALALRAEESLKRLSDDPGQAQVRRKVGGLPPHLSIFELAFAGGGRIYFSKGSVRRHRILLVGTKATQKPDLEFLSRLPKE